ncbi:MAG: hypothetical protein P8Y38_14315 [Deltaproteobacteria bacterium]
MKKAKTERRKHKRFSTRKAAFAVIGPEKAYLAGKAAAVDILSAGNKFFLEKILFKTIMDVDAGEDSELDPIQLKHQRIQFVDLSPDQKEKLEYFLSHCTTCEMTN